MHKLPFEKEHKILIREPAGYTEPEHTPEELLRAGIVILNKPQHMKSIHCVNHVRWALRAKLAGHCGTLDPNVTGVLPIVIGKATKLSNVLSTSGKVYEGTMHLHGEISDAKLKAAFKQFTGRIKQLPSKLCAVKRVVRERDVYWIDLKKREGRDVFFEVGCQHGVYIRKLCHDIGEKIGIGAHMVQLHRTRAGPFDLKNSITLEQVWELAGMDPAYAPENRRELEWEDSEFKIEDVPKIVRPVEEGIRWLGKVWVDKDAVVTIRRGTPVFAPGVLKLTDKLKKKDTVAVLDPQNKLIALGSAGMSSTQMLKAKHGVAVKTDLVLV